MNRVYGVSLATLAIALGAVGAHAQNAPADYTRTVDERHAIEPGAPLVVEHAMGDVDVAAWDQNQVHVVARIEVSGARADAFGEQIALEIKPGGRSVRIRTRYPEGDWQGTSYAVRLRIRVPAGHDLDVQSSFGDLSVAGIRGAVKLESSNGGVILKDVQGAMDLRTAFGDLVVNGCRGDARLRSSNGEVRVEKLGQGHLDVESRFGPIRAHDIEGRAKLTCTNGAIEAVRVGGGVEARGAFGEQRYEQVTGSLEVRAKNATIQVRGISGHASIHTSFGTVALAKVAGDARVVTSSGAVRVEQVRGNVQVQSSFGSVEVSGVGGNLEVDVKNGGVVARGLFAGQTQSRKIDCSVSFGAITLHLPEKPSLRLDAATRFGAIRSTFKLSSHEKNYTSERCKCVLGEGAAEVHLRTKNGDIQLRGESRID